ncbi:MAG TPA: hypothetical protein VKS78_06430 [Roseiarcus sp.]|nr:hypothetical protein [Roseiarcus sp.]
MLRHSLARDVVIALALKMAVVIAAALFVFGPAQRPRIDAGSIATRLMGAPNFDRQSGISPP